MKLIKVVSKRHDTYEVLECPERFNNLDNWDNLYRFWDYSVAENISRPLLVKGMIKDLISEGGILLPDPTVKDEVKHKIPETRMTEDGKNYIVNCSKCGVEILDGNICFKCLREVFS